MKKKNGFISISIIYSFFIVFLLIMLAMLATYTNKRYLLNNIDSELPIEPSCRNGAALATCLINEATLKQGKEPGELSSEEIADGVEEDENGMYTAPDDYTMLTGKPSYYYRGNVDNNYVKYGDYLWRVVRINGDNTYRLIYQGMYNYSALDSESKLEKGKDYITIPIYDEKGNFLENVTKTKFNKSSYNSNECASRLALKYSVDDFNERMDGTLISGITSWLSKNVTEKYIEECLDPNSSYGAHLLHNIGYMNNQEALLYRYDSKYDNQDDSDVKYYIDLWYNQSILSDSDADLTEISSSTIFCGDKNRTKCEQINSALEVIGTECSAEDNDSEDRSFIEKLFDKASTWYEKSERYYYSGWERISKGSSNLASLICTDTGSIATNTENTVLNLSRYNVDNDKYSINDYNLLYLKEKNSRYELKEGTTTKLKKNSKTVTYNSIQAGYDYNNGGFFYHLLPSLGENESTATLEYIGNGDLKYPIALLSADEAVYAGLVYNNESNSYLLDHSIVGDDYWTMTLAYTDYTSFNERIGARYFTVEKTKNNLGHLILKNDYPDKEEAGAYLRPVINLETNIKKCAGKGTIEDPYIVGDTCS